MSSEEQASCSATVSVEEGEGKRILSSFLLKFIQCLRLIWEQLHNLPP